MSKASLVTAPTGDVVTVADLKVHCRIDGSDEDAYLATLLDNAEAEAEAYLWQKLLTQTWNEYFDGFTDPLKLRYGPVSSIGTLTYTDSNGASQTLATSVYELGQVDGVYVVRRKYNQTWPDTRSHEDVVTVPYICGYGAANAVPERIKHAIRLHAATAYRNREDGAPPEAFFRLLGPYRLNRWAKIGAC